jgi:hypothetical protein
MPVLNITIFLDALAKKEKENQKFSTPPPPIPSRFLYSDASMEAHTESDRGWVLGRGGGPRGYKWALEKPW